MRKRVFRPLAYSERGECKPFAKPEDSHFRAVCESRPSDPRYPITKMRHQRRKLGWYRGRMLSPLKFVGGSFFAL